jgi:tRNA A37 threonylcarbamoyladenosine synthetase subunit TsaC/SUA5/YrdC
MRFEVHPDNPQARIVKLAAAALEDDGLVLYPTESGYAIGCNAESPKAIHKLYALKKPMKKFFMALIVPNIKAATDYARVDNFAFNVMKPRVPGP